MDASAGRDDSGRAVTSRTHRLVELLERLTASLDSRNRAYDVALDVSDDVIGLDYPGPPAGCGHIRLVR